MNFSMTVKKAVRFILWITLVSTFIVGIMFLLAVCLITKEEQDQQVRFVNPDDRTSICFIMGEDKSGYRFYELAEQHFLYDENEKSDLIVKTARSMEDIIDILNNSQAKGQNPWGTIQIVVHGNAWSGLSLPLVESGPRATSRELVKVLVKNPLTRLKANRIDSTTKINVWACGIGKNPVLNLALDSIFTDVDGTTPDLYTSPHYVIFKETQDGGAPKRLRSSYWPYFYKRGYRPSDWTIAQAFREQFPEENINWTHALKQTNVERGRPFQSSFHVPVSHTLIYDQEDERPRLDTEKEKINWVKSQADIMDQVEMLGIDFDKFHWTVNRIRYRENGQDLPAIKAIGMSTVLVVLVAE